MVPFFKTKQRFLSKHSTLTLEFTKSPEYHFIPIILVMYFFLLNNDKDCDCKKSFMAIYSLCIDVESLLIADTTGCFARARLYSSETRS